jgi:hypothetical protein
MLIYIWYYLNVFYEFPRAVTYDDRGDNFLSVIIYFSIQGNFQTNFAMRERKSFAN